MKSFSQMVSEELARARSLHNQKINSPHEGYAVILEELEEVWDEIKKKRSERSYAYLLDELVQVAAMAQRVAEDTVIPQLSNPPKQ
jgi:NTP pyrophosphatase (non-canonical NTP hydrolase)